MEMPTPEKTMGAKHQTSPVPAAPGVRPWDKSLKTLHAEHSGVWETRDAITPIGRLTVPITERGFRDILRGENCSVERGIAQYIRPRTERVGNNRPAKHCGEIFYPQETVRDETECLNTQK